MSVLVRYSADAPTRSYVPGPERSRGTTPSHENWTMRCIDAVWLVSVMAFHFLGGVGPFSLYLF